MYSTLTLEFSSEIAKITLNRPEKRNAINTQMIAELQTALDTIEKSHSRVVIVTGAGTSFCAGMDLDMLAAIAKQSPAENQDDSRRIAKMLRRRDTLRFHSGGAGSEIRLHGSENWIPARHCFRFSDPADWR